MITTLAEFLALIVSTVESTGLTPNPHLFAAATIPGPGIGSSFALDIQTQQPTEERRNTVLPSRHVVTVTYWWRYPTQGAAVATWSEVMATEQAIITAIHARRAEWRSTYTGTRRTVNPSAELVRVDVQFLLIARHDVTPE